MGIKQLMKLIYNNSAGAVRETKLKDLFGRKVAMDASMALYSFLIAIRPDAQYTLADESGETTSHLNGMFYRTIRMMRVGVKPVWVFDGKPPQLKSGELEKRRKRKADADRKLKEAIEKGDQEAIGKAVKGTVRVNSKHNDEVKKLLRLMGCPVVEAPTEAEAQCAELVKGGKCWAVGTEDMDALTFGTPVLLRYLTYSEARKKPVLEVHLEQVLKELDVTMDAFIDLCILMGCDYIGTIGKVGMKRAFDLIKEYGSIEKVLANIDQKKYPVPEDFNFEGARELFRNPEVLPAADVEIEWRDPDEEGLIKFMCEEKGFNEDRIRKGITDLRSSKKSQVQNRLTSYFGAVQRSTTKKKKRDDDNNNNKNSKKKKRFKGK